MGDLHGPLEEAVVDGKFVGPAARKIRRARGTADHPRGSGDGHDEQRQRDHRPDGGHEDEDFAARPPRRQQRSHRFTINGLGLCRIF